MSLILQGSTSGSVTLQEPAVAGTTVLTLPAVSGTILTTSSVGSVIQVVSTTKTDTTSFVSTSTNTYVDITGMSVTITPTSATNKILVMYTVGVSNNHPDATIHIRLYRGATSIGQGNASGNRQGIS